MVATAKVVATAVPASLAPLELDYESIADYIYKMESSSGLNDKKCERLGNKHNGYGYRQGTNRNFCLNTDNEVRALVIDWIKEQLPKHNSVKSMLCYYNLGVKDLSECDYVKTLSQLKTLSMVNE